MFPAEFVELPSSHACRVVRDKDPFVNGSVGRISDETFKRIVGRAASNDPNLGVAVCVDGQSGLTWVGRKNVVFPHKRANSIGMGVGRGTLKDKKFHAVTAIMTESYNTAGVRARLEDITITGDYARSFGSLKVLSRTLESGKFKKFRGPLVIMPTDLNVARALNRAVRGEEVTLSKALQPEFKKLVTLLQKFGYARGNDDKENRLSCMVKFEPHRVLPDRFGLKRRGVSRFDSVREGNFHIYPCPLPYYHDAWEVRFKDENVAAQDIFLDYGKTEALLYAKNAAALSEERRLSPSVLAEVDPQAFWAAVLRVEDFIQELLSLDLKKEAEAWQKMKTGVDKSKESCSEIASKYWMKAKFYPSADEWDVSNADRHTKESSLHAIIGLRLIAKAVANASASAGGEKPKQFTVELKTLYERENATRQIVDCAEELGAIRYVRLVSC